MVEVQNVGVRLSGRGGETIELWIAGYQFPEAEDPLKRYSWHMIMGRATCRLGAWEFRYPALTCEESTRISPWLRQVVAGAEVPALGFTEPNLGFALMEPGMAGVSTIAIGLDLEFRPPWEPSVVAGDPFILLVQVDSGQILEAAADWDAEVGAIPTG